MDGLILDILFILFLIILTGFFTGSEIAVISVKQVTLNDLSKKNKKAKIISDLKKNPDRFFATIQIGITLLSTLTSAYGGTKLIKYLTPFIAKINIPIKNVYIEEIALLILVINYFLCYFNFWGTYSKINSDKTCK